MEEIYRCDRCDYDTKIKGNFGIHLKSMKHKENKPTKPKDEDGNYYCEKCNYRSIYSFNFDQHSKSKRHLEGIKIPDILKCEYCDFRTKIKCNHERHLKTQRHIRNMVLNSEDKVRYDDLKKLKQLQLFVHYFRNHQDKLIKFLKEKNTFRYLSLLTNLIKLSKEDGLKNKQVKKLFRLLNKLTYGFENI